MTEEQKKGLKQRVLWLFGNRTLKEYERIQNLIEQAYLQGYKEGIGKRREK